MAEYGLALHTSSPTLGLALGEVGGDRRWQTWDLGRAMATHLHSHLDAFLAPQSWQDLAYVAVAQGPGSFTGTRIGMVTARTLAQQLRIPLFAVSSLASWAWSQYQDLPHFPEQSLPDIAVALPAQRGAVFGAIYQIFPQGTGLVARLPDTVLPLATWQEKLAIWSRPHLLCPVTENLGPSVLALLGLAELDWQQGKRPHWSEALPFYGQQPIAQ